MPESNTTRYQIDDVVNQYFHELILQGVFAFVILITSALFLYLVNKKLFDLNPLTKSILYFLAGIKIILNLTKLTIIQIVLLWKIRNFSICLIAILAQRLEHFGTIISLSMISNVRLYLAIQTSPLTTNQTKQIQYIMMMIYIGSFGIYIPTFIHSGWNGSYLAVNKCSNIYINTKYITFSNFVNIALFIFFILINFVGDATLFNLIWSRRRNTDIAHHITSNNKKNDMSIPIRSTLLSLFCMISVILHLFVRVTYNFDFGFGRMMKIGLIRSIYLSIIVPNAILYEIIRTKESYPVIYQGLQIFDDEKENVNEEIEKLPKMAVPKMEVTLITQFQNNFSSGISFLQKMLYFFPKFWTHSV